MQLSRSRKIVLLGVVLLAAGLGGRASADTTVKKPPATFVAAPSPAATPKAKPKPKPKPTVTAKKTTPVSAKKVSVKGSRMTTGGKGVALTFDDGPDPAQTPRILRLLAKQHVHATFCLVGENVQRHPEMVRQIVAGGHTLCNHTWNHDLKLGQKSADKIKADMQRTNDAIHRAVPAAKVKYFRAPGGNFTPEVIGIAKQLGMTSVYWKVDPRDWDHPKGETHAAHQQRVFDRITGHIHKGSIVLSHDFGQPDTIAAYGRLLPWLKKRYQLIALP
jgi:peptidoglycan/xylan/chitin deacetylase (PgdA/CDA1 family)